MIKADKRLPPFYLIFPDIRPFRYGAANSRAVGSDNGLIFVMGNNRPFKIGQKDAAGRSEFKAIADEAGDRINTYFADKYAQGSLIIFYRNHVKLMVMGFFRETKEVCYLRTF